MEKITSILVGLGAILCMLAAFGSGISRQAHYNGTNPVWFTVMVWIGVIVFILYVLLVIISDN